MFGRLAAKSKIGIALALTIGICLLVIWLTNRAAYNQASQLRSEAGQIALSVAPAELSDEDNAAVAYEEALRELGDESTWLEGQRERWHNDWTDNTIPLDAKDSELLTFLAEKAKAVQLFRDAGRKPGCRFHRDFGHPSISMPLPEFRELRNGVRLLALNARFQAATGNAKGALEDCRALFAMTEHVSSDPFLTAQLIAIAFEGVSQAILEEVLNACPFSADDLADVCPNSGFSFIPAFSRSLQMEEAIGLTQFADTIDGRAPINVKAPAWARPAATRYYGVFLISEDLRTYRYWMKNHQQWAVETPFKVAEKWGTEDEDIQRRACIVTRAILPRTFIAQTMVFRTEARRRLVRLALAVYRFQLARRRFPKKLSELLPDFIDAIPADPFDENPLRMIMADDGLVLYSVDADLADNGGVLSYGVKDPRDTPFHVRAIPYPSNSD